MDNKEVSKKSKKSNKNCGKKEAKKAEIVKKNYGPEIMRLYIENPERTYTSIAKELGCNESTVRQYVSKKGKYRDLVENAIAEHFHKEIFVLQTKAFKRMNELLDDPATPHAVRASIAKYLMDRFEIDRSIEKGEITEWETHISESGILKQTKRTVHVSKKVPNDTKDQKDGDVGRETCKDFIDVEISS